MGVPAGPVMVAVLVIMAVVVILVRVRMIVRVAVIMLVSRVCVGVREFVIVIVIVIMMVMVRSRRDEPLQSLIKEGCADHYDGQPGERSENRVNLVGNDILRKK